jgi:outer membrane lipoprotein-sorting protein
MIKKYTGLLLLGFMVSCTSAIFALTGNEVLVKVDEALVHNNQVARLSMTLTDKRGIKQNREIELIQKEGDKRLVRFIKPADVRGVTFLSLPGDEMYIYMPALGKVRRIASHTKNQSFMGSDFSYSDMGGEKFSTETNIKVFKEEGNNYLFELVSTKKDASYSNLKMVVDKGTFIASKVEFYDKSGRLFKIMANSSVENVEGKWVARTIRMENKLDQHSTELKMLKVNFNSDLSDDIFTQRNMQK